MKTVNKNRTVIARKCEKNLKSINLLLRLYYDAWESQYIRTSSNNAIKNS